MLDVRIRLATIQDLPALVDALRNVPGHEYFFAECLDRQDAGKGMLLLAVLDAVPVGRVYLRFEPAEEPEVHERLPGVPLLQHLEVHPDRRRQGIGTRLVDAAEQTVRDRGDTRLALGVALDNHDAIRLYERLGYTEWPYPPARTTTVEYLPDGGRRYSPDRCRIFVTELVTNR